VYAYGRGCSTMCFVAVPVTCRQTVDLAVLMPPCPLHVKHALRLLPF
jgi:hypothetical protein